MSDTGLDLNTREDFDALLARPQLEFTLPDLTDRRILVTGSDGFIGRRVCNLIAKRGGMVIEFDSTHGFDILSRSQLEDVGECDAVIHLAAHKYATTAEERPAEVADLNVRGTANVVELGVPVILASTCKAADPCTVYGASKLIAERIVLNADGVVIRFVNVLASTGSVLQLWNQQDCNQLQNLVTDCDRMWISPYEAADMMVHALMLERGRYGPDVPEAEPVLNLYERIYGQYHSVELSVCRRGDRKTERLVSENEIAYRLSAADGSWIGSPLLRIFDNWEVNRDAIQTNQLLYRDAEPTY